MPVSGSEAMGKPGQGRNGGGQIGRGEVQLPLRRFHHELQQRRAWSQMDNLHVLIFASKPSKTGLQDCREYLERAVLVEGAEDANEGGAAYDLSPANPMLRNMGTLGDDVQKQSSHLNPLPSSINRE